MLGYLPTLDTLIVEKALFPFLLYSVERLTRSQPGKGTGWAIFSVVLLALVHTSAHAQEAVFISYLLAPYIVFVAGGKEAYPAGKRLSVFWRRILVTLGIYFCALLLGLIQNLPTYEFYRLSARFSGFAEKLRSATLLEESLTWIQSLMIAFPRLFGDYLKPERFLEHHLLNYGYVGIVTLTAGLLSGWVPHTRKVVWFWRFAAIIFFISIISNWFYFDVLCKLPLFRISLQKPFSPLFFSLIVLGANGYEFLLDPKPKGSSANKWLGRETLVIYASTLGVGSLLGIVAFFPKSSQQEDINYAISQLAIGAIIASAAFFVISLLWRYWNTKGEGWDERTKNQAISMAGMACLAIVLIDLWPIKAHFNPFVKKEDLFFSTEVTEFLQTQLKWEPGNPDGPYRFGRSWTEILPPNTGMMFELDDFGGYDSNLVCRYWELMRTLDPTIVREIHYIETPRYRKAFRSKIWNMLGVKYVTAHPGHAGQFEPIGRWKHDYMGDILIVRNKDALPRMHLVERIIRVSEPSQALEKTLAIDPAIEAVVESSEPLPFGLEEKSEKGESLEPLGTVVINRYAPEEVIAHVSLARPALLCFYDVYFPGWEVWVDGKDSHLECVNYAFKGVFLPAGKHEVHFKYDPSSFRYGIILSLIGGIFTLALATPLGKLGAKASKG